MELLTQLFETLKTGFSGAFFIVSMFTVLTGFFCLYLIPFASLANFILLFFSSEKKEITRPLFFAIGSFVLYFLFLILNKSYTLSPINNFFNQLFQDHQGLLVVFLFSLGINIISLIIAYSLYKPNVSGLKQSFLQVWNRLQAPLVFVAITVTVSLLGNAA